MIGAWLRRRRERRIAREALRTLFGTPGGLAGTSLKPKHHGRCMILESAVDGDALVWLRFSILRHPRPYKFSRQIHEVIEYYRYEGGVLTREGSVNASRLEGKDGEPSGRFGF